MNTQLVYIIQSKNDANYTPNYQRCEKHDKIKFRNLKNLFSIMLATTVLLTQLLYLKNKFL